MSALLEVQALNAWYGAAHILFDLSFNVGRGEVVALMGRNGAGKSTTIRALMALIERRRGSVRFCGEEISQLRAFEIARRGLGFVPEDRRIFSDLTVLENLDIGRQAPHHFPDGQAAFFYGVRGGGDSELHCRGSHRSSSGLVRQQLDHQAASFG